MIVARALIAARAAPVAVMIVVRDATGLVTTVARAVMAAEIVVRVLSVLRVTKPRRRAAGACRTSSPVRATDHQPWLKLKRPSRKGRPFSGVRRVTESDDADHGWLP